MTLILVLINSYSEMLTPFIKNNATQNYNTLLLFYNFFKKFGKAITHIQNDMYFQIKSEIHTGYVTNMTPGSTCQILSTRVFENDKHLNANGKFTLVIKTVTSIR